jgi:predicted DsbA family dithiol-disulfide isomerase
VRSGPVHVEIWSDVVCPWCYIGVRKFGQAVEHLAGEVDVSYVLRPYQLDPTASPGAARPVVEAYARKFGGPERARQIIDHVTAVAAEAGIELRMDRALRANTFSAHRLLWRAEQPGSLVAQPVLNERLLRAYFADGLDVGDPDVLADLSAELGDDRAAVLAFLDSDEGRGEVTELVAQAAAHGITAVPTFVLGREWAVPGAQEVETFERVLRRFAGR